MSVADISLEPPQPASTTTRFRWQEQTVASFYRYEDHVNVSMAANNKWNDPDDTRLVQPVDFSLITLGAPPEGRIELDTDYSVRWVMQRVDTDHNRTALTLESLEADYSGDLPVLCRSTRPSLECVYYFARPFRPDFVQSTPWMSPVLCFTGFAEDGDFWGFDTNICVSSRNAFSFGLADPYSADKLIIFTYALIQDRLVPCNGNGFRRMIYAVLNPRDRPIESSVRVDMHGMVL